MKRPGREADHSPPSSAEVKKCVELYLHFPNTPSWRGAQFKKSTGTTLPLLRDIHFVGTARKCFTDKIVLAERQAL
jgi:hypothetical protein